jgi:SAM-dependent methyltransferase
MYMPYIVLIFALPPLYLLYQILVYARTKVPIVATPKRYYREIFSQIKIGPHSVIYDLGSGKGDFLFEAEKFHPKKIAGYELSPLHFLFIKLKKFLKKSRVEIHCRDFFKADISDADIIYLFLVPQIVLEAWQKIKKETRPGTLVIVLSDRIKGENHERSFLSDPKSKKSSRVYVYRV